MKKIYFFLLATIALSFNTWAQPNLTWAKQIGGSMSDQSRSIVVDASGNVYTTGFFNGITDFDPGAGTFNLTSFGGEDIFVSKLNSAGNFVWAKQLGGTANDRGYGIALDASGNIYLTGSFRLTSDFDPGAGTFNLISGGNEDIFVSKLDPNGNFVWAKQLGGFGVDEGRGIVIDASNNVYTTGNFGATVDFDPNAGVFNLTTFGALDIFVSKLDVSGNFVWAKQLGGTLGDVGYSIALDASNNIYTTGSFLGTADFDPSAGVFNLISIGSTDVFVSKLDVSGNFIWAKQLASTAGETGYGIITDASGNVYSTGYFSGVTDFDPGAGTFNLTCFGGSWDVYVSKLDPVGNFVWAKQIGGTGFDIPTGIILDASANVYTTGYFQATADFDPGAGVYNLTPPGPYDVFISKLDVLGNFVWAKQLGGTLSDIGYGIALDPWSDVYTTGIFNGTGDFDPNAGVFNLNSVGSDDIFVHKMCQSAPVIPSIISGLNTLCAGAGATTYSVIFTADVATYTWSLPAGWSGSSNTNTISATPGVTGIFTITSSNSCGTSSQRTLNVTVNPLPTITVNSGTICNGQNFTMVPGGANTYTFQGGSAVVSPTTNTSYTVMGTSVAGCTSTLAATSNVTVNALPSITVNSGSICSGNSFTMVPGGASTYTFQGGSAVVSPTVNTSYTVMGTSIAGCTSTLAATSNVTVNAQPTITVNSGSICSGNSFTIVPSGANTYTIQGGSAVVNPTSTNSYTVVGTSTAGCVSASPATSNVTVNPTPTITVAGGAICPGGSFTLSPSGANTYTFSNGPVVSPTVTTTYSVTGTSTAGCLSNGSAVATVTVAGTLTVTITGSNTVCNGSAISLTAGGATTYTWNTGATTTTIAPTPSVNTTYSVIGASGSCSNTSMLSVTVNPTPTISATTNNTLLCVGQSATLTASGASTYTWNPGGAGTNITVSPTVTANYTITGTNTFGCINSFVFTQNVSPCTSLSTLTLMKEEINIYPNPFSGKITVIASELKQSIQVYNSLGSLVYNATIENGKTEIDLGNQSSGIYFIRIGSVTKKIVKE